MPIFNGVSDRNPSDELRNLTIFNSHFKGGSIDGASITGESIKNDSISNTTFFNGSINSTFIGVDSSNKPSGEFPAAFFTTKITDTLTVAKDTTINGSLIVNGSNVNGSNASFTNASVTNGSLTNISGDNASYTNASFNTGTFNTVDIDGGTIDGTTIGANSAAAGKFSGLDLSDGNITNVGNIALDSISADESSISLNSNWTASGQTCADLGTVSTVDIDGGTIDNVSLGTHAICPNASVTNGSLTNISGDSASYTNASVTNGSLTNISGDNASYTNASFNTIINAGNINITPTSSNKTVIKNASFTGQITGIPVLERKTVYMSASLSISASNTHRFVTFVHDHLRDDYAEMIGVGEFSLQTEIDNELKRHLTCYRPIYDGYIDYGEYRVFSNASHSGSLSMNIHINNKSLSPTEVANKVVHGKITLAEAGQDLEKIGESYTPFNFDSLNSHNNEHPTNASNSFTKDQEIMVTISEDDGQPFDGYVLVILHVVLDTSTRIASSATITYT